MVFSCGGCIRFGDSKIVVKPLGEANVIKTRKKLEKKVERNVVQPTVRKLMSQVKSATESTRQEEKKQALTCEKFFQLLDSDLTSANDVRQPFTSQNRIISKALLATSYAWHSESLFTTIDDEQDEKSNVEDLYGRFVTGLLQRHRDKIAMTDRFEYSHAICAKREGYSLAARTEAFIPEGHHIMPMKVQHAGSPEKSREIEAEHPLEDHETRVKDAGQRVDMQCSSDTLATHRMNADGRTATVDKEFLEKLLTWSLDPDRGDASKFLSTHRN